MIQTLTSVVCRLARLAATLAMLSLFVLPPLHASAAGSAALSAAGAAEAHRPCPHAGSVCDPREIAAKHCLSGSSVQCPAGLAGETLEAPAPVLEDRVFNGAGARRNTSILLSIDTPPPRGAA